MSDAELWVVTVREKNVWPQVHLYSSQLPAIFAAIGMATRMGKGQPFTICPDDEDPNDMPARAAWQGYGDTFGIRSRIEEFEISVKKGAVKQQYLFFEPQAT